MRIIVPGNYYSLDSAQKKIWLDYSYYGLTVENIEVIKNLTRNKIIYTNQRSTPLISLSNGCITYTWDGYSEDSDKLQIVLRTHIVSLDTLSYFPLLDSNGAYMLDSEGKIFEVPA